MPSNFSYITKFGGTSSGTGNSAFSSPRGLATDGRFLWVCDKGNHRIKKLKLQGLTFVAHYGNLDYSTGLPTSGTDGTGFSSPEDIYYWNGLLFISDAGNNRIKLHRAYDMFFINEITGLSSPRGLAGNQQYLWCADSGNGRIIRILLSDLSIEQSSGSVGTGNQQISDAYQIAYDPHERVLYIVDQGTFRLLKWHAFGSMQYIDKITGLSTLFGVGVKEHYVYVGTVSTIKVYADSTLALQTSAGSSGTGNSNISAASYVMLFRDQIFFTDTGNHRLMCWHNYQYQRALTPDSDQVIGSGGWFGNPSSVIGDDTTPIGGDPLDKHRWVNNTPSGESVAWQTS